MDEEKKIDYMERMILIYLLFILALTFSLPVLGMLNSGIYFIVAICALTCNLPVLMVFAMITIIANDGSSL